MNGCVATRNIGGLQFGVFHERYGTYRWNIRSHPIREDGVATDSWGLPRTSATTRSSLMLRAVPLLTHAITDPAPYCTCDRHFHGDRGLFGISREREVSAWKCDCCKSP